MTRILTSIFLNLDTEYGNTNLLCQYNFGRTLCTLGYNYRVLTRMLPRYRLNQRLTVLRFQIRLPVSIAETGKQNIWFTLDCPH